MNDERQSFTDFRRNFHNSCTDGVGDRKEKPSEAKCEIVQHTRKFLDKMQKIKKNFMQNMHRQRFDGVLQ